MANESDSTGTTEPSSAEAVYQQYKQTRLSASKAPTDSDTVKSASDVASLASQDDAAFDSTQMAEHVYRHYKQNRTSENKSTIDALMQAINKHVDLVGVEDHINSLNGNQVRPQDNRLLDSQRPGGPLQHDQPQTDSLQTSEIINIDAKQGQVVSDIALDKNAANSSNRFKRFMLPALAAALLSIALIPVIINQPSEPAVLQASLPEPLLDNAEQSVAFVSDRSPQAFGFTDSEATKLAFNHGIGLVEVELLLNANKGKEIIPYLEPFYLSGQPSADLQPDRESVHGAAIHLVSALNVDGYPDMLQRSFDNLQIEVENSLSDSDQIAWYNAGRIVETIRVAAEYSLEQSDTKSVEQAMQWAHEARFPEDVSTVSPLFDALSAAKLTPPDAFEQTSQILKTVNNIKALMQ